MVKKKAATASQKKRGVAVPTAPANARRPLNLFLDLCRRQVAFFSEAMQCDRRAAAPDFIPIVKGRRDAVRRHHLSGRNRPKLSPKDPREGELIEGLADGRTCRLVRSYYPTGRDPLPNRLFRKALAEIESRGLAGFAGKILLELYEATRSFGLACLAIADFDGFDDKPMSQREREVIICGEKWARLWDQTILLAKDPMKTNPGTQPGTMKKPRGRPRGSLGEFANQRMAFMMNHGDEYSTLEEAADAYKDQHENDLEADADAMRHARDILKK